MRTTACPTCRRILPVVPEAVQFPGRPTGIARCTACGERLMVDLSPWWRRWWRRPRLAYRRWAFDVGEGVRRRDWRIHPIWLYRMQRLRTLNRRADCVRAVAREVLGRHPRFYARRHPDRPWGHGYYDVEDLAGRCRPWAPPPIRRLPS